MDARTVSPLGAHSVLLTVKGAVILNRMLIPDMFVNLTVRDPRIKTPTGVRSPDKNQQSFENLGPIQTGRSPDKAVR